MHKRPIMNKVLNVSLIIFCVILFIFIGLIPISTSYLYGWMFSSSVSLIGFLFGLYIIKITLKHKKKSFGILLTFIRIFGLYVLHIIAIIILVWIDKKDSGLAFWGTRGMDSLYGPINIFTYLGGIAVIPISTLIAHVPSKKGR